MDDGKSTPGKTRLLAVRAERLVYFGEGPTRCTVFNLEIAERRLEFVVKREYDVDLTSARYDVNRDQISEYNASCLVDEGSGRAQFEEPSRR